MVMCAARTSYGAVPPGGGGAASVGAALGILTGKISRIETGRTGLQADEVAALLGFYQVAKPDREELVGARPPRGRARLVAGPGLSVTRAAAGTHQLGATADSGVTADRRLCWHADRGHQPRFE